MNSFGAFFMWVKDLLDQLIVFQGGGGGVKTKSLRYLITPLMPTSASELLTNSTSVPVGASSMMVVWKVEEVKMGTLSFMSFT